MSIIIQETFTGTSGVDVDSRAGEIGAAWTKVGAYSDVFVLSDAGRARPATAAGVTGAMYRASGVSPTPEYVIDFDFWVKTTVSGQFYDLIGRGSGSGNDGYRLEYDCGNTAWFWYATVSGGNSSIATPVGQAYSNDTGHHGQVRLGNALKEFDVDGATIMSTSDNSIAAAGFVQMFAYVPTGASNSTGIHFDNIVVTTADGQPVMSRTRGIPGMSYTGRRGGW